MGEKIQDSNTEQRIPNFGKTRLGIPRVTEGWTGPGRRDGLIEPLKLEDDGLHMDIGQRGMYEWWYFDAHLYSGHTIVVFFHASNPNPGLQGKTGIEIVLLLFCRLYGIRQVRHQCRPVRAETIHRPALYKRFEQLAGRF